MKINHNDILEFHKYFSKISHSKGRIRIRVSPKIRELRDSVSEESLKAKIAAIRGIKEYKFNALIGSLTIHYDESVFPMHLWEQFLSGISSPELIALVNSNIEAIS